MNMVDGAWNLASSNRTYRAHSEQRSCKHVSFTRTNFSESPLHLLTMDEAEMLKKVVLHSVATALANIVLPVPINTNRLHTETQQKHWYIMYNAFI